MKPSQPAPGRLHRTWTRSGNPALRRTGTSASAPGCVRAQPPRCSAPISVILAMCVDVTASNSSHPACFQLGDLIAHGNRGSLVAASRQQGQFFKNSKKTLALPSRKFRQRTQKTKKVFWFFFSKKNRLLASLSPPNQETPPRPQCDPDASRNRESVHPTGGVAPGRFTSVAAGPSRPTTLTATVARTMRHPVGSGAKPPPSLAATAC